jgi:hypothetical protein
MKTYDPSGRSADIDLETVLQRTRSWLEGAVIGLNLCPFAKAVHRKGQIRTVVTYAQDADALMEVLSTELKLLQSSDLRVLDTTLLVHPNVLADFFNYIAFLPKTDRLLNKLDLTGVIQIASFHPDYAFADCATDAIQNYTNRSPYPMLHLLREESIEKAVDAFSEADQIYERNIATLQNLGQSGWEALAKPWSD